MMQDTDSVLKERLLKSGRNFTDEDDQRSSTLTVEEAVEMAASLLNEQERADPRAELDRLDAIEDITYSGGGR